MVRQTQVAEHRSGTFGLNLITGVEFCLSLATYVAHVATQRSHDFQLPDRTSVLRDKNFLMRILYCDALYWQFYFFSSYSLCNTVFVCYFIKT